MRDPAKPDDLFATTCWTAVLAAGGENATQAREALNGLCQSYWYPLYAYARRRGYSPHDAEDLTQGFFARLLRLDSLANLSRGKGKFRAFLLAAMNHYLADEWDKRTAGKRDVTRTVSLDGEIAEKRYLGEPVEHLTPDTMFQRQWAFTLLETVLLRLRDEYRDRLELFAALRPSIAGGQIAYSTAAAQLGTNEGAIRVAAHRLRRRYKELLHAEILRTVGSEAEAAAELDELRRVLSQ